MLAAKGGHTETVKTLIEASADVSLATTTVSFSLFVDLEVQVKDLDQ